MIERSLPPPARPQTGGTAIVSLILGLLGCVLSFLLIGALFAIAGLIVAILHLRRHTHDRILALWGTFVSAAALVLALLFGMLYAQFLIITPFWEHEFFEDFEDYSLTEWEGVEAPNASLTALDGEVIDLVNLKGRRIVLHVWEPDCHECQDIAAVLNELHDVHPREELIVLGLSYGERAEAEAFAAAHAIRYPLVTAFFLPAPYDEALYPPVTFIIDRNGVIEHVIEDHHDLDTLRARATALDSAGSAHRNVHSAR